MDHNYVILSNSNVLVRVTASDIVYISSDGSYSTMVLIDGRKHMFSFNLSSFEKQLETQLGLESKTFIRLGKSLIINSIYIYSINIPAQELILSCSSNPGEFVLNASRDALKSLKLMIETILKTRRLL
ncbi:MAG TPA: hypothetical protein DIS88_00725 [Prevotella sp.]|nr:hypothetical protein [Prevotella sp.]